MTSNEPAGRYLSLVASPGGVDALFEHLPGVYFFVKDAEGRFVRVNRAFLKLVHLAEEAEVIGKRDEDLFPRGLAENYARDDRAVLASNQPMVDKAELVAHADGSIDWFCTTKIPVLDAEHRAIGICGVTRDVKQMDTHRVHFATWEPVLETMLNEYASALDSSALAKRVGLSVSQFNRQFRRRFHTTPRAYLRNIRLDVACHLLTSAELSMSEIALRTGFYDQSHFTNQFVKFRGMPPTKYRARFAASRRYVVDQERIALRPLAHEPVGT
jgi:PAS domain S-box-containing protein